MGTQEFQRNPEAGFSYCACMAVRVNLPYMSGNKDLTETLQKTNKPVRVFLSVVITIAVAVLLYVVNIPNPNLILFQVLHACIVLNGRESGIASAIVIMIYTLFFFSEGHDFQTYTTVNLEKCIITGICLCTDVMLIGSLHRHMEKKNAVLEKDAEIDELVRIRNRRGLRKDFRFDLNQPVFVMMMDIDDFKGFNDTHGHAMGDEVLKRVASTLVIAYGIEHCYRFGGDEFLVIAPYESSDMIRQSDSVVRRALENVSLLGRKLSIHLSAGVIHGTAETEVQLRNMVKSADEALYEAKQQGKNRCCIKD